VKKARYVPLLRLQGSIVISFVIVVSFTVHPALVRQSAPSTAIAFELD
jgi:hypothetical protein